MKQHTTLRVKALIEIVKRARKDDYLQDDLDELVRDVHESMASRVNSLGPYKQVKWLIAEGLGNAVRCAMIRAKELDARLTNNDNR